MKGDMRENGAPGMDGCGIYEDSIREEDVTALLHTKWAGRNLICYEETDSTNLRIKELGREGALHGTLAVADRQTAGRGRRGRSWESPAGCSIYMSILLRPDIEPDKAPMLTLVTACAVAEALVQSDGQFKRPEGAHACGAESNEEDAASPQVQIKWPNDIIINGKKLVGILTEMSVQNGKIDYVTIGVGINVNIIVFPEEIKETATSLCIEYGHKVKREPIIAAIMERLETDYEIFMRTQDLSGLMDTYSKMLVNKDRDVVILGEKEQYRAHALGITPTGELIIRREDGTEEEIYAGEVSVRGVYGYV